MLVFATGVFVHYYVRFSRMIDARLSGQIFNNASLVLAAPAEVSLGEATSPEAIAARLRKAQYSEGEAGSGVGTYRMRGARLEIYPGHESFFRGESAGEGPAALEFRDGRIVSITAPDPPATLDHYLLAPEVITTLFDQTRAKRRLVQYQDLPKALVDAVLAAEDHRFFSHHGVSIYRIFGAAVADLRGDHGLQGGSTLTMQLARDFFLTRKRTWPVKLEQAFLALLLEQRLSKQQIFELYANQTYLGQRGSFSIYGFGEAADAYFNKDVRSLTLPEAALLGALIRGPNLYSPYKYAGRAKERRNFVLRRMVETGFITSAAAEKASEAPLGLAQRNVEGSQAPFFVDMVKEQLLAQFAERDLLSQSYRIYTTLDLDLQAAASEAVRSGMEEVDQQLRKKWRKKGAPPAEPNQPQVALVVLDPHTGALKALVGGRDYGISQLNHALARRQPGSSFKPFVYAAALSSGVDGSQPLITAATVVPDEPTTFGYEGKTYEPKNYKQEYRGLVTVREALAYSLNNATVRLAEMVGYGKVRNLAVAAGISRELLATPALALGAYVATPLEIAGAYTIFANGGQYVGPRFISVVRDASGQTLWQSPVMTRPVLDPRVSYLMVSLMESVINSGTAAGVRARGFALPAAGKTGTSHDGWFAGFTSKLLAVVWVGYDDDRELNLSGASSALPVWTTFMRRATVVPGYRKVQAFTAPPGIITVPIDIRTNVAAFGDSIRKIDEVFIEGTEPRPEGFGGRLAGILRKILPVGEAPTEAARAAVPPPSVPSVAPPPPGADPGPAGAVAPPETSQGKKRGGFVRKVFSIFKRGGRKSNTDAPAPEKQ